MFSLRERFIAATVVVVGSALALVSTLPAASAPAVASPAAAVELPPPFQAWLDTYAEEDAAAFAALYTEDGVYEDVPAGEASQGRAGIAEFAAGYFEAQDDYVYTPRAFFQTEEWAVLEFDTAATDVETGIRVSGIRIATVFELEGDLIRRSSDYYDTAGAMAQIEMQLAEEPAAE